MIPIVFAVAGDPVGSGLVASLARPGGNVTGLSNQSADLPGKRLELLREVVPGLRRLAILANAIGIWLLRSMRLQWHIAAPAVCDPCPVLAKTDKSRRNPRSSQHTTSPSIRQDRTLRWFTASTTSGKRPDQSLPLRVSSRMPTGSRRAIRR